MSYSMTIKKPKVSEILQQLMQIKGIRVAELARRIDLKQPTLHRIVTGLYQQPRLKTLKPIADFFEITLEQLTGIDPIPWLSSKKDNISRIPVLMLNQINNWLDGKKIEDSPLILVDIEVGKKAWAMRMPDASMEPVFPKGTLLILDPEKQPKDRYFIAVKLHNYEDAIFRQLLIDGKERYIKPLSPDLDRFKMSFLKPKDTILGVLVQARLNYES